MSNLKSYANRIIAADKSTNRNHLQLLNETQKAKGAVKDLFRELIRPNEVVMEAAAAYMEMLAAASKAICTVVSDAVELIPKVTEAVKEVRDRQGYYSLEEVEEALSSTDDMKKKRNRKNATSVDEASVDHSVV